MAGLDERTERAEGAEPSRAPRDAMRDAMRDSIVADTYRLTRVLGEGGMGQVWEAEHLRLGRHVAIKMLRQRSDQKALSRFRREMRVIAGLDSDHVVGVFDSGELDDGTPYLVMELLRGSDLRIVLQQQERMSIGRAVRCVMQAARGITAAHRAGVVHRDLKPENLFLVQRDGGDELCKVLDFGVAKTETSELTQQGTVIGTIKYMAPEQLEDSTRVGPATDVYGLGAILYECLAGQPPHVAETAHETMFKILAETPRSVRERRPDVPQALADVVLRAMARKVSERMQTSAELEQALAPFAHIEGSNAFEAMPTADLSGEAAPWVRTGLPRDVQTPPAERGVSLLSSADGQLAPGERRALRPGALLLAVALGMLLGGLGVWLLLRQQPVELAHEKRRVVAPLQVAASPAAAPRPAATPTSQPSEATAPLPTTPASATPPLSPVPVRSAVSASPELVERRAGKRASSERPGTVKGLPAVSFDHQNPYEH